MSDFTGFPGIGKATALPNLFFSAVLPQMETPGALLAFLWVSRISQDQRADQRYAVAEDIWNNSAARESFERLGGGRAGLEAGLEACLKVRALIGIRLRGAGVDDALYFPNDPMSRRTIARVRAGEISLRPETSVLAIELA